MAVVLYSLLEGNNTYCSTTLVDTSMNISTIASAKILCFSNIFDNLKEYHVTCAFLSFYY
jgi:hypothetical protein